MAERRHTQETRSQDVEYDSRLYMVGALWAGTSKSTGNPILTGEISLGLDGLRDILVTENNRPEKGEKAPTHLVFIRVPLRRGVNGQGNGAGDGLNF